MQLIIFGAPGVGKGTQAKIISDKTGIKHISTGDILRSAIQEKTQIGIKAKEIVDSGNLVPDDVMADLIKETLQKKCCEAGFILDGFPRTISQAESLTHIFAELNIEQPILIKLNTPDDAIINRLTMRRQCSNCGTIVNLNWLTEKNKCPNCLQIDTLIRRKDDSEEIIKNRLNLYHKMTSPVLNYYKDRTKIVEIDSSKPVEEVTSELLKILEIN